MIVNLITPAMIKYNISSDMIDVAVKNILLSEGYELKVADNRFEVNIESEKYTFQVFDNGIVVFNYSFEMKDSTPYKEILTRKEEKTKEIIDRNGKVVIFLKCLEESINKAIQNKKESYFFNGKYVSYCLTTYKISERYNDTAYSLAFKREIAKDQIATLKEQSLKVINVNEHIQFLMIWGARVVIGDDELSDKLYYEYVKNETEAHIYGLLLLRWIKELTAICSMKQGEQLTYHYC